MAAPSDPLPSASDVDSSSALSSWLAEHQSTCASSFAQIAKDLPRTLSALAFLHDGEGEWRPALEMTLRACAVWRPGRMTQGVSYIAAMLLLHVDCDAEAAFVALANLLEQPLFARLLLRLGPRDLALLFGSFDALLLSALPAVHARFHSLSLRPDMFLLDWLLTGFARSMPLELAARIWDGWVCAGAAGDGAAGDAHATASATSNAPAAAGSTGSGYAGGADLGSASSDDHDALSGRGAAFLFRAAIGLLHFLFAAPELSGRDGLGDGAPFESAVEAVLRPPHALLLERIDQVLECIRAVRVGPAQVQAALTEVARRVDQRQRQMEEQEQTLDTTQQY